MGFWTAIIIIVAITAGSSMVTGIVSAIRPKIKKNELDELKAEILRDLGAGDDPAISDSGGYKRQLELLEDRLDLQENEIRRLGDDNSFLRRLLEDKDAGTEPNR